MLVKFLKPYSIFKVGETTDMMRSKAAELKAQGIITDDPKEIRKKNDNELAKFHKSEFLVPASVADQYTQDAKSNKPNKTVVPNPKDTTVK